MKNKKVYVVKFEKGYYADEQSGDFWCYTNDRDEAREYVTNRGALTRVRDSLNEKAYIETIEITLVKDEEVSITTKTLLERDEWTPDRFQEIEDKLNEKKAAKETERLKRPEYQTNIKVKDEPNAIFWNEAYNERVKKREAMSKKFNKFNRVEND